MLKKQCIDNFALVGLVVVHGVPADEKFEVQRRILSSECTSNFQVLLLNIAAFESRLCDASYQGSMAHGEMYAVCKQLKAISAQLGWCEVDVDGVHVKKYFCNPLLGIRAWWKPGPYGRIAIEVGMVVEINKDIESNLAEHGYEGALWDGMEMRFSFF